METNDRTEKLKDALDQGTGQEPFEALPPTEQEIEPSQIKPKRSRKKTDPELVLQEAKNSPSGEPAIADQEANKESAKPVPQENENALLSVPAAAASGPEGEDLDPVLQNPQESQANHAGPEMTEASVEQALLIEQNQSAAEPVADTSAGEPTSQPQRRRGVMTIGGGRSDLTAQAKRRQALIDLAESKRSGRLLTGMVAGVEGGGDNPLLTYAVIHHGPFKVLIPVSEMIDFDEEEEHSEAYRFSVVSRRMGAEIDYVVTAIDEENGLAAASRVLAMRQRRRDYFMATDRNGRYLLEQGDIAEARIVSVLRSGAFVELFGLEQFIPTEELSYLRMASAAMCVQVGQRVLVKILELTRSGRDTVRASLSVRQAEAERQKGLIERYKIGELYVGTVTMIAPMGIFVAFGDDVSCLCQFSKRGRPAMHATVTVKLLGMDRESLQLWGVIVHF